MRWPATESLQRAKLSLEVGLLIVLLIAMLYVVTVDRSAAIKLGMVGK